MIIADTKGELREAVGGVLEQEGYRVMEIDFTDCLHSPCGYNPLRFIRYDRGRGRYNEQDILTLAACLAPVEDRRDSFWELSARMYIEALAGYVLECLPSGERSIDSMARLLMEMRTGVFQKLIQQLAQADPDSFAVRRYGLFQATMNAEKMYASILGIAAEKLSVFTFDGAKALFANPSQVRFDKIGEKKTAVFLTVSDTDRSLDRLVTLFYTQALQALCASADQKEDHRLPVPVRFFLDDFAANVFIPDFEKTTSIIRSREISVSIILQSLSQLDDLYGHAKALTILNNCDHLLYLGGQDIETARYISVKANRSIHSILDMPLESAWLFTRGSEPESVRKYRLEAHPRYRELPEYAAAMGGPGKKQKLPEKERQEQMR